eukprot:1820485-Rhodomonas_salina.1
MLDIRTCYGVADHEHSLYLAFDLESEAPKVPTNKGKQRQRRAGKQGSREGPRKIQCTDAARGLARGVKTTNNDGSAIGDDG